MALGWAWTSHRSHLRQGCSPVVNRSIYLFTPIHLFIPIYLFTQVVNRYIDQGTAELVPGVLFIDEVWPVSLNLIAHHDSPSVLLPVLQQGKGSASRCCSQ